MENLIRLIHCKAEILQLEPQNDIFDSASWPGFPSRKSLSLTLHDICFSLMSVKISFDHFFYLTLDYFSVFKNASG